jgi:hypothetical protein
MAVPNTEHRAELAEAVLEASFREDWVEGNECGTWELKSKVSTAQQRKELSRPRYALEIQLENLAHPSPAGVAVLQQLVMRQAA